MNGRQTAKENMATLFNRYVWLVDTIHRRGRITFEELNRRWQRSALNPAGEELPRRTFHNHRPAILTTDIPITSKMTVRWAAVTAECGRGSLRPLR